LQWTRSTTEGRESPKRVFLPGRGFKEGQDSFCPSAQDQSPLKIRGGCEAQELRDSERRLENLGASGGGGKRGLGGGGGEKKVQGGNPLEEKKEPKESYLGKGGGCFIVLLQKKDEKSVGERRKDLGEVTKGPGSYTSIGEKRSRQKPGLKSP